MEFTITGTFQFHNSEWVVYMGIKPTRNHNPVGVEFFQWWDNNRLKILDVNWFIDSSSTVTVTLTTRPTKQILWKYLLVRDLIILLSRFVFNVPLISWVDRPDTVGYEPTLVWLKVKLFPKEIAGSRRSPQWSGNHWGVNPHQIISKREADVAGCIPMSPERLCTFGC